ncbi:MAG: glycine cleavage system aminomethyltransferase GcvT [Candidatus Margulisbacteria bacterium]|nr:glycine cleavage system aminomethyltransferase GcvT [Candidatus Margulisiibacteriota bacterium]
MKKTFLYDQHKKLHAKMIDFAGYQLPVWFNSIKEEHLAVRQKVGVFDISHMGVLIFSGSGASDFLQSISCNDIQKTIPDKMIYSMVLNEMGGVLDDIMVGRLQDQYVMVVNSSNKEKLHRWFQQHQSENVTIQDLERSHGFLALQGPLAIQTAFNVLDINCEKHPRFSVWEQSVFGETLLVMRTGYTGEDGIEMVIPKAVLPKIWQSLLASGVTPCGLGARDTLRIEAGLPLYGQELTENIHPLMTRYKWVVKFDTLFHGKESLQAIQQSPSDLVAVGIEMDKKQIPRPQCRIVEGGYVTSGTLSPLLDKAIGMAYVKVPFADLGSSVHVEIRGQSCLAMVVALPFIP